MLRQQISGIFNLSLPLIIAYHVQPALLVTMPGQIYCSLMLAAYLYYLNYRQLQQFEKNLQFSPTGNYKNFFNKLIEECQVDPAAIIIKYAYTYEQIAMAAGKTVIIDPIVWIDLSEDPQAIKVQEFFTTHIEPGLTAIDKERIVALSRVLNLASQRFIFKHELGHIAQNFSVKKLMAIFVVGFLAAYSGIITAVILLPINGLFAILCGMIVGGVIELFLTYLSNIIWKLYEEKAADQFAVKHSSKEDSIAAARFFENHQAILDTYKNSQGFLDTLPSVIKTGHLHGVARSAYILKLMANT